MVLGILSITGVAYITDWVASSVITCVLVSIISRGGLKLTRSMYHHSN